MSGTTKSNIIEPNEYQKKPYQFGMKFANHRVASIPIRRNRYFSSLCQDVCREPTRATDISEGVLPQKTANT
jgi:hypothetical protein